MKRISLLSLVAANFLVADELKLDSLDVSGSKTKNEDKPFVTPGAVSTREDVGNSTQSIDSIIRSVPGAFTQIDQEQGGVSVNIRGTTGFGRVNTQIDGVTQTFFGSATDNGFHGTIGTSAFSAPIDKNFLIGVDIERGTFSGANGGNALMGSANFRTIGVDDIVKDGKNYGILGRYSYGSNAVGPSAMLAGAVKIPLKWNEASFGALFAYSGQNISQNYKIGGGGYIGDQKPPFDQDDDGVPDNFLNPPINPERLSNKPRSQLAKMEYSSENSKLVLSYRGYGNNLAGRKITNDNYQADFKYTPESDYINVKTLFAYNEGKQIYNQNTTWGYHDMSGIETDNRAITFDINNTMKSKKENLWITYGFNMLNNRYGNDFPEERVLLSYIKTSFYPKGKQNINSFYVDTTYKHGIFDLSTNIDWVTSSVKGRKEGECSEYNNYCNPKSPSDISKRYNSFNYSLVLSADIHPLFTPFVSYAKTHRIPNIQEYFFTHDSNEGQSNINTELEQESAKTYQIGFNSFIHGVLHDKDTLGLKILYYNTKVENYIYNRRYWLKEDPNIPIFVMQFNDDELSKFRGIEAELKYDIDFFYTKLSYAYQKAEHKFSDTESLELGGAHAGFSQFAKLPEHYANLDMGARFFDRKLNIGFIAKYTGEAKRIEPVGSLDDDPNDSNALTPPKKYDTLPKIPTIVDVYASYEPFKDFIIKGEIQNVMDKNYMDALYVYNTGENQNIGGLTDPVFIYNNSARGRTFIISAQYRF